jgi:uncharacterized membrane protein YhaH (DUF805 family)
MDDEGRRYMRKYGYAAWQQWVAAGRPEPAPPALGGDEERPPVAASQEVPTVVAGTHPSATMSPTEALRTVLLSRYADFRGRASRTEYWWWFGLMFGLNVLGYLLLLSASEPDELVLAVAVAYVVVGLATLVPSIAVTVRRFHDQGRSGWWILMAFVPIIGWLLLLAAMVPDSERGPNRWGPPPAGSAYADPATWESPEVI